MTNQNILCKLAKKINYENFTFYFLLSTFYSFSQYFIPFGEDSIYNSYGNSGVVQDIFIDDTICYIGGGAIHYAGNQTIYQIGAFYNDEWHSLNNGFGGVVGGVLSITKFQNKIYMGGYFTDINDILNTENIGRFNGTTWESLPNSLGANGVSSDVNDMVVWDNKLIIAGGFQTIGSTYYNLPFVAAYDGNDYIDINDGEVPFVVEALAVFNDELYASGGWFSLKKYIGNKHWVDVGGHFNYYSQDMLVDTFNNFLYVAGGFNIVDDTIPCDNIAFWDGYKWTGVGNGEGAPNDIQVFTIYRGELYVQITSDSIGGVNTGGLAKWNGTTWEPAVPGGIKYYVNSLAVYNDELWIGGGSAFDGNYECPFDTARESLARWYIPPTVNCNYLQARIQSHVDTFYLNQAVQIHNNNAYVDSWSWDFGDSGTANIQNPYHTYTDTGSYTVSLTVNWQTCQKTVQRTFVVVEDTTTSINTIQKNTEQGFKIYPNPTKTELFVEIRNDKLNINNQTVEIHDINGKLVNSTSLRGTKQSIDISALQKGTYFIKIGTEAQRFIKE